MMKRNLSLAVAAVLALGAVGSASAATATDDLTINATVGNYCEIVVEDVNVNLSLADGFTSKVVPMSGGLQIFCNMGTAYSIEPGQGLNFDVGAGSRTVADGAGHAIPYTLWQDTAASIPWDTGTPLTGTNSTGTWEFQDFAVRFDALDQAPGGTYGDTATLTLTYN